ncbi:MAG: NUDIX domain-containing protein [Clostridiales bacterium]|nr:NUDIX domain-containing protein [Clostridiales bacterium]
MHEALVQGRLYVTVDMLILTVKDGKLNLLLSRRKNAPYAGRWALPGRFVGVNESAETAVRKLLNEMLPVRDAFLEQLYTFSDVNRDPRGRVISTAYLVIIPGQNLDALPEETKELFGQFAVTEESEGLRLTGGDGTVLIGSDLAFDHGRIIETGVLRLQGKIDYTDVGFRFLNNLKAFSLGELETVFEAVLGKKLDSSNFRRSILKRYEETGRMILTDREDKQKRGRPASLYQLTEKEGKKP